MAVAMKDLEIRGAGSILGAEQSGHIAGVGFDLYIRLVGEAVNAFKKAASSADGADAVEEEPAEVRVELPIDANIPHDYIPVERLRLDAYRRIAGATSPADVDAVREELVDRYGPLGEQVENLLAVASFRQLCRSVGVTEVAMGPQGLRMAPIHLPESGQMRLARMYPGSKYRELTSTLTLRRRPKVGEWAGPRCGTGSCCGTAGRCWRTLFLPLRWSADRFERLAVSSRPLRRERRVVPLQITRRWPGSRSPHGLGPIQCRARTCRERRGAAGAEAPTAVRMSYST